VCQEAHGAAVLAKQFFLFPKVVGMGSAAAALKSHGVLYVKHLMIKHIRNHIFGYAGMVELPVQDDLVQCRIETPELRAPYPLAPTKTWSGKRPGEISSIQFVEKRCEIMVLTGRAVLGSSRAAPAEDQQSLSNRPRVRKAPIRIEEIGGWTASVKPS